MSNIAFNSWEESLMAMNVPARLSKIMGRIYESGLTTPSGGNCSIRAENGEIWLTPSQVDKGALSPEDMIKCDVSGKFHGKHAPTSEHPFHRLSYNKRHDVNAIVHSHPLSLVSFALSDKKPDCSLIKAIEVFCGKGNIAEYAIQ
jgi:L-fuculose-phosphate aldolase